MENYATSREEFYRRFYSALMRRYWRDEPDRWERIAPTRNWFDYGAGKTGLKFGWSFHRGGRFSAEIYIDSGDRETNLAYLGLLRDKCKLTSREKALLSWEQLPEKRACRIAIYHAADVVVLMDQPMSVGQLLEWASGKMRWLEESFRDAILTL